jgi:hypothetical protein
MACDDSCSSPETRLSPIAMVTALAAGIGRLALFEA